MCNCDKTLDEIIPGENRKEKRALAALPSEIRGFFVAHYGTGIGNRAGEFLGLVCRCCNRWQEYGHKDDCPVRRLERKTKPHKAKAKAKTPIKSKSAVP